MFETIWAQTKGRYRDIMEPTIELAIEIAREGREGHRIGTVFTVGDAGAVLERSRPLILDPLAGHPEAARHITDADLRGTLKELAQLDGAFVISDEGVVVAACRYLDAITSDIDLSLGLGSRHFAAASISKVTKAIGIVVSESALVRVFADGALIAEILPELWLLSRRNVQLHAPFSEEHIRDLAVLVKQSLDQT
jgi:DNA integrity scanning protein DisA with diadenylate cyclase activity